MALSPPGRFSTTTGWPSCSASAAATMRVVGSAEPPGGKPTMKRSGLAGYWACAAHAARDNTSATAPCENRFMPPPQEDEPFHSAPHPSGCQCGLVHSLQRVELGKLKPCCRTRHTTPQPPT